MRIHLTIILSFLFFESGISQIQTEKYDTTVTLNRDEAIFFTNRPVVIKKDSSITFKNKSTKRTNTLYFCLFNYDSIIVQYKAAKPTKKFPTGEVENNIFYDIHRELTENLGISNFYILIPGYGKTFHNQVFNFMKRLKSTYGDTLFMKSAVLTFGVMKLLL